MLLVCEDMHDEIVHQQSECPICKMIEEKDNEAEALETTISELKEEITGLKEEKETYKSQVDDLESQLKEERNK